MRAIGVTVYVVVVWMTNDWSLKGKKWEVQPNSFGEVYQRLKPRCLENDFEEEYEYGDEPVYSEEDIETLRQKLIEDIEEFTNICAEITDYDGLMKRINKRFGVEKDE